jgi:dipeptidyl-peptidase-4
VARINTKGKFTLLHDVKGTEDCQFSSGFDYYVRNYSSINTPPQYTLWTMSGSKISDLQLNIEYASRYSSAPKKEFITVKNAQGEDMDGYIIKPADFDPNKKYPLVMYQYNGPDSQEVRDRWGIDGTYYIASCGYVVACVDGRGTCNRSRQWANSVYKQLGVYETQDQIAGAKHIAEYPFIDDSRMACFGWSYGGYMTLMELSDPSCPFKAGIAMAPVTDWRFYDSIYTERFMLTPQQNESGYNQASALSRTKNMNSRLLIMSGTSDDNVHFYNTLKYTSKLNYEGKVFDMMALTGFEHSLRMCNARTMLFSKIVDFLNTNIK